MLEDREGLAELIKITSRELPLPVKEKVSAPANDIRPTQCVGLMSFHLKQRSGIQRRFSINFTGTTAAVFSDWMRPLSPSW